MTEDELDVLPGGIREAARRLGRGERAMYKAAARGELPFVTRIGRVWIVPKVAFERFLRGKTGSDPVDSERNDSR